MEKKKIIKTVFSTKNWDGPVLYKEITIELQPEDRIRAGFDEGFYSENESWDAHWFLEVEREFLETDEEFEKRKKEENFFKEKMKKRRYESYLKLKKEFDE